MFATVKNFLHIRRREKEWRRRNPDNETSPQNDFSFDHVTVGRYTYGGLNVYDFGEQSRLHIGHYCSIGSNVMFILNADHPLGRVSTFPFHVKCLRDASSEAVSRGDITVEDDVWIGYGATILSGVRIGQGAVVGAGSLVTKDVPPYAVVGGTPARVLRYRFSESLREKLLQVDYERLTCQSVQDNLEWLYMDLTEENAEELLSHLPRKQDDRTERI